MSGLLTIDRLVYLRTISGYDIMVSESVDNHTG